MQTLVLYTVAKIDERDEDTLFRAYLTEEIKLALQRKIMQTSWIDVVSEKVPHEIPKPGSVIEKLTSGGAITVVEAGDEQ